MWRQNEHILGSTQPGDFDIPRERITRGVPRPSFVYLYEDMCKCKGTKSPTVVGSKMNPEFGRGGGEGKNKNIFKHLLRKQDKSNFGYIKALLLWKGIC